MNMLHAAFFQLRQAILKAATKYSYDGEGLILKKVYFVIFIFLSQT